MFKLPFYNQRQDPDNYQIGLKTGPNYVTYDIMCILTRLWPPIRESYPGCHMIVKSVINDKLFRDEQWIAVYKLNQQVDIKDSDLKILEKEFTDMIGLKGITHALLFLPVPKGTSSSWWISQQRKINIESLSDEKVFPIWSKYGWLIDLTKGGDDLYDTLTQSMNDELNTRWQKKCNEEKFVVKDMNEIWKRVTVAGEIHAWAKDSNEIIFMDDWIRIPNTTKINNRFDIKISKLFISNKTKENSEQAKHIEFIDGKFTWITTYHSHPTC